MNVYSLRYVYILFMYIKCVFLCLKIHWHLVCWIFDSHVNCMLLYIYLVGGENEYSRSEWRWALNFLCMSFVMYINGTDKLYLYNFEVCIYTLYVYTMWFPLPKSPLTPCMLNFWHLWQRWGWGLDRLDKWRCLC